MGEGGLGKHSQWGRGGWGSIVNGGGLGKHSQWGRGGWGSIVNGGGGAGEALSSAP